MNIKSGVTQELRTLAKSNLAAEAKNRRRAVVMAVAAVLALGIFAVVRWLM